MLSIALNSSQNKIDVCLTPSLTLAKAQQHALFIAQESDGIFPLKQK